VPELFLRPVRAGRRIRSDRNPANTRCAPIPFQNEAWEKPEASRQLATIVCADPRLERTPETKILDQRVVDARDDEVRSARSLAVAR